MCVCVWGGVGWVEGVPGLGEGGYRGDKDRLKVRRVESRKKNRAGVGTDCVCGCRICPASTVK